MSNHLVKRLSVSSFLPWPFPFFPFLARRLSSSSWAEAKPHVFLPQTNTALPCQPQTQQLLKINLKIHPAQPQPSLGKSKDRGMWLSQAPLLQPCPGTDRSGVPGGLLLPLGHLWLDLLSIMGLKQLKAAGLNISRLLGK